MAKTNFSRIHFIILLFTILFFFGCKDSDIVDKYSTFEGQMIGEYLLKDSAQFSDFIAALRKVNGLSLLNTYGKYTCFIPSNEAMQKFYQEKGKTLLQLDSAELKELVFYHLIDGETANTQVYKTTDYGIFGKGPIPTKNMAGRFIYTSLSAGNWLVDSKAKITEHDIQLINGVVHVVDKVLEGNKDLLPNFIASNSRFSLFSRALTETKLEEALRLVDDATYTQGSPYTYARATYYNVVPYPKQKKYGFTAFIESDSIMKLREGIDSFEKLVAYAKSVYDDMYPEDKDIADFTDPRNSLNRFVAYHLVNKKVTTDELLAKWGNIYYWSTDYGLLNTKIFQFDYNYHNADNNFLIEQYMVTMLENSMIAVQVGNFFNVIDPDTKEATSLMCRKYYKQNFDKSKFVTLIDNESNKECLNGIYHSLNNMLVYTKEVESKVFHKRLRFDFRTFLPELVNNEYNFESYTKGPTVIPSGYCKNLTYNEEPKVRFILFPANVHPYSFGDDMLCDGFINLNLKVGPIPPGKYEVRIGYVVRATTRGITQYYFDGKPCGIPLDQRISQIDPAIGWQQVYNDVIRAGDELSNNPTANPDDPDGLENDKQLRNRGYMKGPDSFCGVYRNADGKVFQTARNSQYAARRILGIYSFNDNESRYHNLGVVQMQDGDSQLDYIEFMPVDLIPSEDTH